MTKLRVKNVVFQLGLIGLGVISSFDAMALTAPTASNDSTTIYYKVSYTGSPTLFQFYLDTDASAGTGYSISGIGANYLIEGGSLYKFAGSSSTTWGWTFVKNVTWSTASGVASASLLKTDVGSPSKILLVARVSSPVDTSSVVTEVISSVSPGPSPSPSPTGVASNWVKCASENGTCSFSGTHTVRYGTGTSWVTKVATGSIACNNATFGDPAHGYAKECDVDMSTSPSPSPTPTSTSTGSNWVKCAVEGGTCSYSGTYTVRYGTGSSWTAKKLTNGTACSNSVFGDPANGYVKECDIDMSSGPAPSPSPTVMPSPSPTASSSLVNYSASSANIVNPERGFFWMTDCRANPKSISDLQNYRAQNGHSVIHCEWYLRDFKSSAISPAVLSQLATQMDNVRKAGFKMILRFVYTSADTNDAPLSVVLGHLNQLAPYLQQYSDIITTVQTGIIGQWGEMSTSVNYGAPSSSTDWANRKAVIDKLLSVLPANRMVSVRTPQFKSNPYGSTPLSQSEAYTGTSRARVGFYNDCFLSGYNDWSTFRPNTDDLTFQENDSKYVTTSGETCALATDNDCSNALTAMASRHWTHLHEGYQADVITKWKSQGCFPTIQQKLGYRFQLDSALLPNSAKVGGAIAMTFNIENVGYAAPYNPRGFELVLKNTSTGTVYHVPLKTDPRVWQPGAVVVNENVTLPSSIPAGTYSMWMNLPDPAPTLYGSPYYSIQLANSGLWDSLTGFNNLNHNLVISN